MKRLLNTVYVTSEGAALRKDGENLVASVDGEERSRVPFHMLASIVAFGAIHASPALMEACGANGITLVFLDRAGRFQARVEGPVTGNVLLRRAQYRASDAPDEIVRSIVLGKIANQRSVLLRAVRDHGDDAAADGAAGWIEAAANRLERVLRRADRATLDADGLRGDEGEAAAIYFGVFDALIRSPDPQMHFAGRSRRPLSTASTRSCPSSTRCSPTTAGARPRRWASTPRSGSCTAIAPAGRALPSTSWRSSGPSLPTGWPCRWSTGGRWWPMTSRSATAAPCR